jgi:hypothetical protein
MDWIALLRWSVGLALLNLIMACLFAVYGNAERRGDRVLRGLRAGLRGCWPVYLSILLSVSVEPPLKIWCGIAVVLLWLVAARLGIWKMPDRAPTATDD